MKKSRVEVPEDLVIEILYKLPVKSLTRFKCVCKYWCSSFQNPVFISKHYRNNLRNNNLNLLLRLYEPYECPNPNLLIIDDIDIYTSFSTRKDEELFRVKHKVQLPFFNKLFEFDVYGPCNGLLCLYNESKAVLWNPSTREFKILPPSPSSLKPPSSTALIGIYCAGFGFDSRTDDYKIIQFVAFLDDFADLPPHKGKIELYSLKSNSWKEISSLEDINTSFSWYSAASSNNHVDGICYWLSHKINEECIISFDMVNEKFSTLPLPGCARPPFAVKLFDSNGSLGLIVYNWGPWKFTDIVFDSWVMNGAGGVWNRQFRIDSVSVSGVKRPLQIWKHGELFFQGTNGELFFFDPSTRELRKLGIYSQGPSATVRLTAYVESLVSINGRSET